RVVERAARQLRAEAVAACSPGGRRAVVRYLRPCSASVQGAVVKVERSLSDPLPRSLTQIWRAVHGEVGCAVRGMRQYLCGERFVVAHHPLGAYLISEGIIE